MQMTWSNSTETENGKSILSLLESTEGSIYICTTESPTFPGILYVGQTCSEILRAAAVRRIIRNWVIDHGEFARGKSFTIMDPGFNARAAARKKKKRRRRRKRSGRDIAGARARARSSRWNIPAKYFGATACARVNEAFVIRKQRLLGARTTGGRFFRGHARYFLIPTNAAERSNRSNNSAERGRPRSTGAGNGCPLPLPAISPLIMLIYVRGIGEQRECDARSARARVHRESTSVFEAA